MEKTLRPYQSEAIHNVMTDLSSGQHQRLALVLPTGGGKTFTMAHIFDTITKIFKSKPGSKTMFVVHRDELVNQAYKAFAGHGIHTTTWTRDHKNLNGDVIVVMIQSSRGLAQELKNRGFRAVLVAYDEGHRFAASSYQNFNAEVEPARELIVTATPIRTDGMSLGIDKISYEKTFPELVQEGYLARPDYRLVRVAGEGNLRSGGADFKLEDLKELNNETRNRAIAEHWVANREESGKTLCFCVDVNHCMELMTEYQLAHPKGEYAFVTGNTSERERKRVLQQYAAGNIDVLFNVDVFTEGFDDINIRTVQLARPTKSQIRWAQMVGRGARLAPGKDVFRVYDYSGERNNYAWLAERYSRELLGAPADPELEKIRQAEDFRDQANEWLKEQGFKSKKFKTREEVLRVTGALKYYTKSYKVRHLVMNDSQKAHLDAFFRYYMTEPPASGAVMTSYVERYMQRIDRSLIGWPGKFVMNGLAWCMHEYRVNRRSKGKPLISFVPMPDFHQEREDDTDDREAA